MEEKNKLVPFQSCRFESKNQDGAEGDSLT